MAGKVMLNPWVYGRSRGRNSRRSRRNRGRVPGMLRAPKWGLYRTGGRKRRYNRTAQRYRGLEARLMARRRALGLNRGRKRPGPKAYRRGFVGGRHGGLLGETSNKHLYGRVYGGRPYAAGFDRGLAQYLEATAPRHRQYNRRGGRRRAAR